MTVHMVTIVSKPKMDAGSLVSAVCSCGRYESAPSSEHEARKSWGQHAAAKIEAEKVR